MKKNLKAILIGITATFLLFSVLNLFITSEIGQQNTQLKIKSMDKLSMFRNHLEYALLLRVHSVKGIAGFIELNSGITHEQFQTFAAEIYSDDSTINNITLIKETTIKDTYPYENNKAAIGVNLLEVENQREGIKKVIKTKRMVIDGPVKLIQGGVGIISRIPIYIKGNGDLKKYWGMISIVLKRDVLFETAYMNSKDNNFQVSVRDINNPKDKQLIWGKSDAFNPDSIKSEIILPNSTWQLAANINKMPYLGDAYTIGYRLISLVISCLAGIMLSLLVKAKSTLHEKSYTDSLTGLPNRSYFYTKLEALIKLADTSKGYVAVLFLDIDKFKAVNDTYGHHIGDLLLKSVAKRLTDNIRKTDVLARLGGDEFTIIIPELKDPEDVKNVVDKIRECFSTSFICGEQVINVGTSVGYSMYPKDAKTIDELIINSDTNMYKDKKKNREGHISKSVERRKQLRK